MTTSPTKQPTLNRLQNWFQAAITHPEGVSEGVASPDARRHIAGEPADAESVLTRSAALSALDRLAVYGHAYFARLLDCLREEYPVLKYALGAGVFDAFAAGYLQSYPSRSYTLFALGTEFPRFLRETRPALEDPGQPTDWADFLIDLATLELAFNEVFDGPGVEGQPPFDAPALATIREDRLPDSRLMPVPCLRLLALQYPVHTYFTAVRREEEAIPPDPAETFLAITRRRYVVTHYVLSRPAYLLLGSLLAGETIGTAIVRATGVSVGEDLERLETNIRGWFHDWAAEGFFSAIEVPG